MKQNILRCFVLFICTVIVADCALAQAGVTESWHTDYSKHTKEQADVAAERMKTIEAELENPATNEWAGTYDWSDGGTSNEVLMWTPRAGFLVFRLGCYPGVHDLNYGSVSDSPTMIQMLPALSSAGTRLGSLHARYLPVKWGERHYLIAEDEVSAFYDSVTGIRAEQDENAVLIADFLLKRDDVDKPIEGMPVLPPGYERFVRKPIDASISKVGKSSVKIDEENEWWNELVTPVEINAGKSDGVKVGMVFRVLASEKGETVEITHVSKVSAKGIIVRSVRKQPGVKVNEWDDGTDDPEPEITVGWMLSTSPYK